MSKWRARAKHFVAEGGPKESLATSATSTDRPINALGMECEGNHPRRERFGFAPCKREVWSGRDGGDHPKTIAYLRTWVPPSCSVPRRETVSFSPPREMFDDA